MNTLMQILADPPWWLFFLFSLLSNVASGLWGMHRERLKGRLGAAIEDAVLALMPLVEEAKAAAADGKLTREEAEHFYERAVEFGLGSLDAFARRVLLLGPRTAGAMVEERVEAAKGGGL